MELEIIDSLLLYLKNQNDLLDVHEILRGFKSEHPKFEDQDNTIYSALLKLIKDEYVVETNVNSVTDGQIKCHHISFDGIVFLAQGGYLHQIEENRQMEIKSNEFHRIQISLRKLTAWVAVGSVVAAAYYAIEIYKFLKVHFGWH